MALNNRNGPKLYEVYLITCRVSGKRYVGKTAYSAKYRCYRHKMADDSSMPLHRAIKKHGWENFTVEVLYQGVDEVEIGFVERAAIASYDTYAPNGYNVTIGGDGRSGRKMSEESLERMRAAQKGKRISIETRAKMSLSRKGRATSLETIAKMSASKKGKPSKLRGVKRPQHVIDKIAATRSSLPPSEKRLEQMVRMRACVNRANPVWCLETGEMWINQMACAKALGGKSPHLNQSIDRHNRTFKGLHFVSHVG